VSQQDPKTVPLQALVETRQRARTAEDELASLRAEMESLKQQFAKPANAQAPVDQQARELLATIQAERAATTLQNELGLASSAQVAAVQDLLAKNSGLTPAEALGIATKRKPDLFAATAGQGFDPSTHGNLRPRPGGKPDASAQPPSMEDIDAVHKKARAIPPGKMRKDYVDKFLGNMARSAMGLGHLNHK
jgi:hypothetical protein